MADIDHLVLLGAMGVGKTTVGRIVATRLGRPLRDSDLDLRATGRNARDLALTSGVDALHHLEAEHLMLTLAEPDPVVVAAAASVVDDQRCLAALEAPFVVWLWAPFETLAERMQHGDHRRDLGDDPLVAMAALAQRRDPAYRQVADTTIDVRNLGPGHVAEAVLSRFGSARSNQADRDLRADGADSDDRPGHDPWRPT